MKQLHLKKPYLGTHKCPWMFCIGSALLSGIKGTQLRGTDCLFNLVFVLKGIGHKLALPGLFDLNWEESALRSPMVTRYMGKDQIYHQGIQVVLCRLALSR